MYGLLDLIWAFGLRIRQHPLCKRTWPMPTFLKPSYCDLSFHLMQVLRSIRVHLLHDHCEAVIFTLWLMSYLKSPDTWEDSHLWTCMLGCGHLYLMPCLILLIACWLLLDSKSKGKVGFLYDILVCWIASHWSNIFNS